MKGFLELSAEERPRLGEMIESFDALIVRSMTQVDADLLRRGTSLKYTPFHWQPAV